MSWKTAATVIVIVFVIAIGQAALAGPATNVQTSLNGTGDYNNDHFNGNKIITTTLGSWFNMGLVGIFGIILWGFARVIRQELTRGGGNL
jgi:hypothetical protein